ncbi:MAG: ABC transporter ATP-binding protein [Gemmatimonadota bacterium]
MIRVDNLTYVYPGATRAAVADISFAVSPGEIFGLLGPSGAGKSTTQRVLMRLNRRFSGTVEVLSRSVGAWDHSFYTQVGVGFEVPNHYLRLTGRENLELFAALYRRPTGVISDLLARVGLADAADERVADYSKGMKMRLGFVRALLNDPQVLLLDEPTAGLDPVNASVLKDLIREGRSLGKTILLTTHNMADVEELCDRVGFLVDGSMMVMDTPGALRALHGRRTVRVEHASGPKGEAEVTEFPLDGLAASQDFRDVLGTRYIRSIHSQEASLNQVFAAVTGVSLTGGSA